MTNPINLEETYNELSKLLKDLCGFLSNEVQNGTLSLDATSQAQNLLQRIQKQEEIVSKIATIQEISNSNYPYLQMQRPVIMEEPLSIYVDADHIEEEEMYELTLNETDELFEYPSPSPIGIDTCPYLELPLTSLPEKAVKYGPLIRKEKYFIIEQKKHLIVGLVGCWLLIYHANKKDVKPNQVLNMIEYKAQIKKEPVFEIVSENKKTHEFTAKSVKDMDQWIVAINCKIHRKSNIRNLPDVPQYKSSKDNIIDNASISLGSTCNDNESEIYENIDETRKLVHDRHIEEYLDQNAPKLPARKPDYIKKIDNYRDFTTNYISDSKTDKYNGDDMPDSVQEEAEDEDFYDELRIIDTVDTQNMKITNPSISKPATPLSENNYNNTENNFNSHTTINKNNVDSEEEEVEYDELKFNSHNNFEISTEFNTPEFEKSSKTSKSDILKSITPKLQNTETRNSQEKNNTGNCYKSPTSNINKNNVDSENEEVEYDELNTPEHEINTFTPKQILTKPIVTSPKPKNIESKNAQEKNNSGNYNNSSTSTANINNVDSEDEETEYDELKYNSQNNYETSKPSNTSELEINIKSPNKITLKPTVTSPKPKILESKRSQDKINSSRIHNLIQQMEASSLLKKKK